MIIVGSKTCRDICLLKYANSENNAFNAFLNAWKTKTTADPEFYFKYEPIGMKHVGLNHEQGGNRISLG